MAAIETLVDKNLVKIKEFLADSAEPSAFVNYEDSQLLILRRLRLMDGQLLFWSECFLFNEKKIHYYNRAENDFQTLKGGKEFCNMLASFYENNEIIILGYSSEVEELEDSLFDREIRPHFMDTWFKIKKDLAKFENFYYRNIIVFQAFQKFYTQEKKSTSNQVADIYESIGFQDSSVQTLKARLESVHHLFDSIKQERLNKSIYTLTVISAIFLPMNLIVGFFGMNTQGLFFSEDTQGTMNVVLILTGITVLTLIGLKVIRMVDKYLLRFFLGRFNFYTRITDKFEKMDRHLKGH